MEREPVPVYFAGIREIKLADEILIQIEGLDEVCEFLERAPRDAIPGALLHGGQAGGAVIEQAMIAQLAPHNKTGELMEDLDTTVTLDGDFRGVDVAVGFSHGGSDVHGYGMDYVARFLEFGHRMVGHAPNKKLLGQVEPKPFMRPAAEIAAEAAIDAFEDAVLSDLASKGILDAA